MERTILIRKALPFDRKAIFSLYRELDETHQVLDVELRHRTARDRQAHVQAALNDSRARAVVACQDEVVVGFLLAVCEHRRPDANIEALAVDKSFRRRGIGTQLIRDTECWARKCRVRHLKLQVYEFNPEARAFYESLGYLTTSRTMQKDPRLDVLSMLPAWPNGSRRERR